MKLLLQPLPVRIFHWVMFVSVMILLFTGLYMNSPWEMTQLPLRAARKLHTFFSSILVLNLIGQIYYYIYTWKFTEVLFLPRDWTNIPSFFRYVFFITESHPNFGRYNPGQKVLFSSWLLAVIVAAGTGLILLLPDNTVWLQRVLGGLPVIRVFHFGVAVFFLMSIPLHFYLVFTESPAKLQAMFTGYLNKEPKIEIPESEKQDQGT